MPAALLPPSARPVERHLEQAAAHYDEGRDVPIDALWDPARCPAALLPWLAWALGVRRWDAAWSPDVQRAVIASSIPLHRIEGTPGALRTHLDAIGAIYDVTERPGGAAFSATVTIHNSAAVGTAALAALDGQLADITRLSVEHRITLRRGAELVLPIAPGVTSVTVADWTLEANVA